MIDAFLCFDHGVEVRFFDSAVLCYGVVEYSEMLGVFVVDCSELALNHIYIFPLQYFEDEGVVDFKRGVRDSAEFGTSRSQQLG